MLTETWQIDLAKAPSGDKTQTNYEKNFFGMMTDTYCRRNEKKHNHICQNPLAMAFRPSGQAISSEEWKPLPGKPINATSAKASRHSDPTLPFFKAE